jgi:hypothetical protein
MIQPGFRKTCQVLIVFLLLVAVGLAAEVPPRTFAGQSLEVAEDFMDLGNIYFLSPGRDTQLTIVSRAQLTRSVVTANRIVGFVVTPWEVEDIGPDGLSPLLAGAFRIPVHGLRLGYEFGDSQLWNAAILDKEKYPEISFEILGTEGVERRSQGGANPEFELTVKGRLLLKGSQIDLTFPARLTFLPSSRRTMARNVGDLLSLQASLTLTLEDLGLSRRGMEDLMGEEVEVDLFLMFNTISPDRSLNPMADPEMHRKQLRFLTLLRDLDRGAEAYSYGLQLMKQVWDDEQQLQRLARAVIDTEGVEAPNLSFALKGAARATQLVEEKDPGALSLLAEIQFRSGRLQEAIETQQKVLALPDQDPHSQTPMKAQLQRYQAALEQLQ